MLFKGGVEDRCPISFVQVLDIDSDNPVGFDEKHVFECDALVEWLAQHKPSNLMTTKMV
jgi:hypothetical protein